jgi:hypothetical protein
MFCWYITISEIASVWKKLDFHEKNNVFGVGIRVAVALTAEE